MTDHPPRTITEAVEPARASADPMIGRPDFSGDRASLKHKARREQRHPTPTSEIRARTTVRQRHLDRLTVAYRPIPAQPDPGTNAMHTKNDQASITDAVSHESITIQDQMSVAGPPARLVRHAGRQSLHETRRTP